MIKPTAVKLYDICVPVFPVLLKHLPHNRVRFNLPRALHGYNTTIACNVLPPSTTFKSPPSLLLRPNYSYNLPRILQSSGIELYIVSQNPSRNFDNPVTAQRYRTPGWHVSRKIISRPKTVASKGGEGPQSCQLMFHWIPPPPPLPPSLVPNPSTQPSIDLLSLFSLSSATAVHHDAGPPGHVDGRHQDAGILSDGRKPTRAEHLLDQGHIHHPRLVANGELK